MHTISITWPHSKSCSENKSAGAGPAGGERRILKENEVHHQRSTSTRAAYMTLSWKKKHARTSASASKNVSTPRSAFSKRPLARFKTAPCHVHVHVRVQSMLCCGVVTHSTPWRRATDLRLCNESVMQMTVYMLNAVLCILLCSPCLPLESEHTAKQHLRLQCHAFLV